MIIKLAILLAVVLIVAAFAAWAFLPARHLPGNRARHLRVRLHLRLHPGKGFAHLFSLWLRWSRFAVLRRSGQIRPELPWRYSLLDPGEHSVSLGRAHYRHGLRVPLLVMRSTCSSWRHHGPIRRPEVFTGVAGRSEDVLFCAVASTQPMVSRAARRTCEDSTRRPSVRGHGKVPGCGQV